MNQPQEGTQKAQEARSGVEAGQGQGQRLKQAKNAPITSHAKRDMEAALSMARKQRTALDLEIQQLEAALGRVRDEA